MTKYNNYAGVGAATASTSIAILDPHATQIDPISGATVMNEVLTIAGPTPTPTPRLPERGPRVVHQHGRRRPGRRSRSSSTARTARSTAGTSPTNPLTQQITLTTGIGEAYTPTLIGPDGTVYAINNAMLFSIAK